MDSEDTLLAEAALVASALSAIVTGAWMHPERRAALPGLFGPVLEHLTTLVTLGAGPPALNAAAVAPEQRVAAALRVRERIAPQIAQLRDLLMHGGPNIEAVRERQWAILGDIAATSATVLAPGVVHARGGDA